MNLFVCAHGALREWWNPGLHEYFMLSGANMVWLGRREFPEQFWMNVDRADWRLPYALTATPPRKNANDSNRK